MSKKKKSIKFLSIFALLLVLIVAATIAFRLVDFSQETQRLPLWDMADHGYDSVKLVESVKNLDFIRFLDHINGMGVWPPVFPIMEFPVFLIFGYDYSVARAFVSILFAFCILAIFLVGSELENSKGILVGAISVALMCLSPFYQLFGVLVMLEIPGTLLLLLATLFYIKYVKTDSSKYLKLTCIFTVALFFCKYNYGLMWIIPLAINEAWRESLLSRKNIKNAFSKLIQFGRNKPFFADRKSVV